MIDLGLHSEAFWPPEGSSGMREGMPEGYIQRSLPPHSEADGFTIGGMTSGAIGHS